MTNAPLIFDRKTIRQNRNRIAPDFKNHNFLFEWSQKQIEGRLNDIKRTYSNALQIGARNDVLNLKTYGIQNQSVMDIAQEFTPDIIADEEFIPFAQNTFDLVSSNLNLHSTNDLPGALSQIKYALKPDGLFIASIFGGETLYELRQVMQKVEMEMYNGVSPRIFPFADLPQMGALMQRAQFNLPVIDSEKITVTYENIFKLFKDLKLMGESNSIIERRKNFTPRGFFMKVAEEYQKSFSEPDGRIVATFEIIFLLGWKPHESQQKPLKPGSAKNRLADALNTNEGNLPC